MRFVLIQVRDDMPAEDQERLCFLEACGLEPEQLECINLTREPDIAWSQLAGCEALLVGGAGAYSATQTYGFTSNLEDVIRQAVDSGLPFFGSCFGHHAMVRALGGSVVTDHQTGEVGTFEIELTSAGRRDPLLADYPDRFAVQLGHHDRVQTLPEGMVELAASQRCRFQMLRLVGKPVYSSQFHAEMTDQHLLARLEMYRDTYLAERTSLDEISSSVQPSPWADRLLSRFRSLEKPAAGSAEVIGDSRNSRNIERI